MKKQITSDEFKNIEAILQELAVEIMSPYENEAENKRFLNAKAWTVRVVNPEYGNLGDCTYSTRVIRIAPRLVKLNDVGILMDILRHECAHALAGIRKSKNGKRWDHHGPHWKLWAIKLGAMPTALCYPEDFPSIKKLWKDD